MSTQQPTDGGDRPSTRDYCFRHSLMYDGSECPRCVVEQDRQIRGRPATSVSGESGSAAGSGADGRDAPVSASQAAQQSRRKSQEAQHFVDARAPREAFDLSAEALDLDPGNLQAYLVSGRAARLLGDTRAAQDMLEKAVGLLRVPEYRSDCRWYIELLKVAQDPFLIRDIVREFVAARDWPPKDLTLVVRTLVTRDLKDQALRVLDRAGSGSRSLGLSVYAATMSGHGPAVVRARLADYLDPLTADQRGRVLAELAEWLEQCEFPRSIIDAVVGALRIRYDSWRPEIERVLAEEARAQAARQVGPSTMGPALAFAARVLVVGLVAGITAVVLMGGGVPLVVGVIVLALGGAAAAFTIRREALTQRAIPPVLSRIVAELEQTEQREWAPVLERPDGGEETGVAAEAGAADAASTETPLPPEAAPSDQQPPASGVAKARPG